MKPAALDATALGTMVLLCLTWSLQQISLKAAADLVHPMAMVALRSALAALPLALLMGRRGERLQARHAAPGALAGALFALEYLLVSEALRLTAASHVVVFLYTAPVFAALGLHWRLPAERLGPVAAAGIALAFAGIAVAFLGGTHDAGATLWGDALALTAGLAWGATTVVIRCTALAQAPASETLLYQLLGAALLLAPVAVLSGRWHVAPQPLAFAHLAFQSVVVSFASFLVWFWLLRRYLASRLGVLTFLTPMMGVALGAWLLGEALTAPFLIGSALVLAGIVAVSAPRLPLSRQWRRARGDSIGATRP